MNGELSAVLEPAGPLAARLAWVWWIFFGVCAVVYLVVMAVLVVGLLRRDRQGPDLRRRARVVTIAGAASAVILILLLGVTVQAGHGLNPLPGGARLTVKVVARQWWWEFEYQGSPPSQMVTTANELHIPVGQPVLLQLIARDVIHSFWVPALHGKRDMIPGHESTTYLQADRAGVFRGRCAEFCGDQHAKMAFLVIAEPPDQFQAWLRAQRKLPDPPASEVAQRGQQVLLRTTCPTCHTILGTPAAGRFGPELSHLGSRQTLGAATRPNDATHLADWIRDPQAVKPGTRMPPTPLPPADLQALVTYLENLR